MSEKKNTTPERHGEVAEWTVSLIVGERIETVSFIAEAVGTVLIERTADGILRVRNAPAIMQPKVWDGRDMAEAESKRRLLCLVEKGGET